MFLETLILIFVNTENLCTSDEFLVSYILNLFRFSYFFLSISKRKKTRQVLEMVLRLASKYLIF